MKAVGFDELVHKLKEMQRRAREINGKHRLAFSELFSDEFMKEHTDFNGFLPDDEWEKYVSSRTQFASWNAMREAAAGDWISKQPRNWVAARVAG